MNKVILMGRLTRDPDVRYSQGENSMAIARYTLAVDRRFASANGQREADFIGCVAFGRQAEFAQKYLHQGTKIAVTGRIQTGSYQNKEGQKVYTTDVIIEEQEFAESRQAAEGRRSSGSDGFSGGERRAETTRTAFAGEGSRSASEADAFAGEAASFGHGHTVSDIDGFMNIPESVESEGLPFN